MFTTRGGSSIRAAVLTDERRLLLFIAGFTRTCCEKDKSVQRPQSLLYNTNFNTHIYLGPLSGLFFSHLLSLSSLTVWSLWLIVTVGQHFFSTVIPRLTKIIRSGITFVSRNTHTDGKDKLLEWPDRSCLLLYVSARLH